MAAVIGTTNRQLLSYSRSRHTMTRANPPKYVDVCIVGSGFAGLSAAIVSGQTSQVAVLEKMSIPGGNSVYNAGQLAVAGSSHQRRANIDDSVKQMVDDMLRAGKCGSFWWSRAPVPLQLAVSLALQLIDVYDFDWVAFCRADSGVSFRPHPS